MDSYDDGDLELDSDVAERNYLTGNIRLGGSKGIDINKLRQDEAVEFEVAGVDSDRIEALTRPADPDGHFTSAAMDNNEEDEDNATSPFQSLAEKMEKVTDDGGVKKLMVQQGVGSTIPRGYYATVHYKALLEHNDEPYDSTYLRGRPLKFILGDGEVFPGFDIAVSTMKKREISQFLVESAYHLGEKGCPPRVPGGVPALFHIELKDFVEVTGVEAFYRMTLNERKEVDYDIIGKVVKKETSEAKEHFERKRYRDAVRNYQKAVKALEEYHLKNDEEENKQQAELLRLYTNLSLCHLSLNQLGSAIRLANQAIDIKKTHVKGLYLKGKALQQMGEFGRAKACLNQAKKIKPGSRDINNQLALLDQAVKKFELSEKLLYKRMFNNAKQPPDTREPSAGLGGSELKVEGCSEEFRELIIEKLQEFKDADDIQEMPLPQTNLSSEEKSCIANSATKLGLLLEQRSQDCVRILKPNTAVSHH